MCYTSACDIDLASCLQQKQSTELAALLPVEVMLQHLKELITWILSQVN